MELREVLLTDEENPFLILLEVAANETSLVQVLTIAEQLELQALAFNDACKPQARKLIKWLDRDVSEGCDDRVGGLHEPDCQCGFGIYIGYKTWQALKKALDLP